MPTHGLPFPPSGEDVFSGGSPVRIEDNSDVGVEVPVRIAVCPCAMACMPAAKPRRRAPASIGEAIGEGYDEGLLDSPDGQFERLGGVKGLLPDPPIPDDPDIGLLMYY